MKQMSVVEFISPSIFLSNIQQSFTSFTKRWIRFSNFYENMPNFIIQNGPDMLNITDNPDPQKSVTKRIV